MTTARARRVERLEDAAARRAAREAAIEYELTAEETALVIRDTRRALLRWRAGLPISLDWMLDEATAEYGLSTEERTELAGKMRARLDESAGRTGW